MAARKVDLPDAENPSIMIRTTRSDDSPAGGAGGLGGAGPLSAVAYSKSGSLKSMTIASATVVRADRSPRHGGQAKNNCYEVRFHCPSAGKECRLTYQRHPEISSDTIKKTHGSLTVGARHD
jgi:hypothetical protein